MTEGAEWTDIAAIYILSYGKNTFGNRLYGFLGLPSKMSAPQRACQPLHCIEGRRERNPLYSRTLLFQLFVGFWGFALKNRI